jgi:uncharacterized membrane protein YhaH (DUF805 family)
MNNNETLFSYITSERRRGVTDDAILTALRGQGWDESSIRSMMHTALRELTSSGARAFSLTGLFRGRIGRWKYFAAGFVFSLSLALVVWTLAILGLFVSTSQSVGFFATVVITLFVYALAIPFSFGLTVRRAHDIGWTGWSALWMIVPVLGFIYALILLFRSGQSGVNMYGPPADGHQGVIDALLNR